MIGSLLVVHRYVAVPWNIVGTATRLVEKPHTHVRPSDPLQPAYSASYNLQYPRTR